MSAELPPERLTPEGWDTDEWFNAVLGPAPGKTKTVQAIILHAAYYPDKETIAVHVRREDDGREAISYLPKAALRFGGKRHVDVPREETDRQMRITADLFLRRKGSRIKICVFDN